MNLTLELAYDQPEEMRPLLTEYTDMLLTENPAFSVYLEIQNYDAEIRDLRYKYGTPEGRLYLARLDGAPVGCVALRKLDDASGELKRMYVRPQYRGKGIAAVMLDRIISDAREIGYKQLYLDTLPFLTTAIDMYRRKGFRDIPCYNDSPLPDTVYMVYDL